MLLTSIIDYLNTLKNPFGVFRTLGEVVIETDIYGEPYFRAGNSAAIFRYRGESTVNDDRGDHTRFLKCYIRPNPHLRAVYDYIERERPRLLPRMRLLRDELYVHSLTGEGGRVDLVEGEWTPGVTLDVAVVRAARTGDKTRLEELADAFDVLCRLLSAEEWAHGDLKPENIVVRDDGELTLIDCDGMWIPALAGQKAAELGTPGWCDPARTAAHFDKRIDDYSMMLVSARLRVIALDPADAVALQFFTATASV